jgi:alpha-tubulin suppressor-like RCC1 family protein
LAHDCPADLAPAASCTLTFTFSPTAAGSATGSATVAGQEVVLGGFGDMMLVSQVVAGWLHTLALRTDGTLWATGHNSDGQLGLGDTTQRTSFVEVVNFGCAG